MTLDSSKAVFATVKFSSTTFSTLSMALPVNEDRMANCASRLALVAAENCSGKVNIISSVKYVLNSVSGALRLFVKLSVSNIVQRNNTYFTELLNRVK